MGEEPRYILNGPPQTAEQVKTVREWDEAFSERGGEGGFRENRKDSLHDVGRGLTFVPSEAPQIRHI